MAVSKARKQEILEELRTMLDGSTSVFFSDFRGIPVSDIFKIRRQLRGEKVGFKVSKKTLIRIATKERGYADIPETVMAGSCAMVVGYDDPIAPARLIHTLAKTNEKLTLLGGLFEGTVLSAKEAMQYATLPSKHELLSKLVYLLKSPIQGFHGSLHGLLSKFVRTVDAVAKQRAGGAA